MVQRKLVDNLTSIDDFVDLNCFSETENEFYLGWKNLISRKFIVMKHLKNYSVFYSPEMSNQIFGVIGITSTINELLNNRKLPAYIEAVLLPRKDKIITTGIIAPYNIVIGKEIKFALDEKYKFIKGTIGITTQL